jgi:hypothetical protein
VLKLASGVATGALGALGQLLGPLQQLQQLARSGNAEAGQTYDKAVTMLRKSSDSGNQDAEALLEELGEALNQPTSEERRDNAA